MESFLSIFKNQAYYSKYKPLEIRTLNNIQKYEFFKTLSLCFFIKNLYVFLKNYTLNQEFLKIIKKK